MKNVLKVEFLNNTITLLSVSVKDETMVNINDIIKISQAIHNI